MGNVLAPQGNGSAANLQYSNCGGVPMLTVGNYFYIYYNERVGPNAGDAEYPAVARATISSVMSAFANNTVPAFYKYNDGTWTQPALTGLGSPILPNSVSTNAAWAGFGWPGVPVNTTGAYDVHSDAAYCSALGEYILTVDTCGGGELLLYTSSDGVNWGNKTVVDYASGCWQPYSTLVGFDSSASATSGTVGASFDLYFTRKSTSNYRFRYAHLPADHHRQRFDVGPRARERRGHVHRRQRHLVQRRDHLEHGIGRGILEQQHADRRDLRRNGGHGHGRRAGRDKRPDLQQQRLSAQRQHLDARRELRHRQRRRHDRLSPGRLGGPDKNGPRHVDALRIECLHRAGHRIGGRSLDRRRCGPGRGPGHAEVDQLTLDGGTLQTTATVSLNANRGVTLTPNGGVICVSGSGQATTINGIVAGSGSLTKVGAGTLILPAANTYTGGTTIAAGMLTIGNGGTAGSFGAGPAIISNSGTLVFDRTDNYGGAWSNGISGPGSVTVVAGSLVFSGSNSYTGATTISGGSLYLNGANATSAVAVAAGTTLGGSGSAPSAVVSVANGGTLDFSQNSGNTFGVAGLTFSNAAAINIGNFASYASTAAINVAGSNGLTFQGGSGSVTIFLSGLAPTGSGAVELVQYAGSIQGAGSSAVALNTTGIMGFGPRTPQFSLTNPNGFIDLTYDVDYPVWTGAVNGVVNETWNGAAQTWRLALAGSAVSFLSGDHVVFDDSVGTGSTTVSISTGNVNPGSVTFSNTAASYALTGAYGITGSATLTVNGAGSVTIANSNGYSGGTIVSSGTLNATGANALGSGPLGVNGGDVNVANAQSITATNLNSGVLNVSNSTTLGSGPLNLNGGLLNLSSSSATLGSGPLNLNGGTLDNTSGSPMTLGGNNPENWNGSFAFLGSSPLNLGTAAVTISGSPTVLVASGSLTVGGPIGAGGNGVALAKAGTGMLTLTSSSTYGGGTTVSGGTLLLNHGASTLNDYFASSAISIAAGATFAVNQTSGNARYSNVSKTISGAGTFTKLGAGLTWLANDSGQTISVFNLSAGGLVDVQAGTLASLETAPSNAGDLEIAAGATATLDNDPNQGRNAYFDALSGGGWLQYASGTNPHAITLGTNNGGGTFSGTISNGGLGPVSFVKTGTGTQILSGANSYTGVTTISQGNLTVNGSLVSPVTVNSGGILSGTGRLTSMTVTTGGSLSPGNPLGSMQMSGTLSLLPGAVMDYELDAPATSGEISMVSGQLILSGQQFSDFNFTWTSNFAPGAYPLIEFGSLGGTGLGTISSGIIDGYPANLAISGNELVLNVVPEPSTLLLLGIGVIGLLACTWRPRRQTGWQTVSHNATMR